MKAAETLLKATGLRKTYTVRNGRQLAELNAVSDVDFTLHAGETLGVVGESGCGKTTLGRMLVRLLKPTAGRVEFAGRDVTHLATRELSAFRRAVQMVFQDPYSSLDPRMTAAAIVSEPLDIQRVGTRAERRTRVDELLDLVGIPPEHGNRLPASFSGGQRQRIGVARALALSPQLLVLDEPVSALDVSIKAQLLKELQDLQRKLGLTYIFISHDLSVVKNFCDRVLVMYLGRIVEEGPTEEIFSRPAHPYTKALLSAVPRVEETRPERIVLAGDLPDPRNPPSGCVFRTRCWMAQDICAAERPALAERTGLGHASACRFATDVSAPRPDRAAAARTPGRA